MSILESQLHWPSLAQDLAVMTVPGSPITELDQILRSYSISSKQLKEILTIPSFQKLFEKSLKAIEAMGTKAAHIHRATALSQSLSEKLFRDAMADGTRMKAQDAIKLLELLLKSATLLDGKESAQVNVQTNVGVALSLPTGLNNPKIRHLEPRQAEAIDV